MFWPSCAGSTGMGRELDLMICNYVYEHVEDQTSHAVHYTNVFP